MTSIIAVLVVVLLLGLTLYAGLRDGVFFTSYALLRNVFAFFCAMSFCEPLARALMRLLTSTHPAFEYFRVFCFLGIFGVVFVIARWLKMKYTTPYVTCPKLVDRIGGPILGLFSGVVVSGTLLVLWSLLPFAKYMPGDSGRIEITLNTLDTGVAMLRFYGFAEQRMGGGRPFLLEDEPLTKDRDNDGRYDRERDDQYEDLNRNGRWDRGWIWRYHNHAELTSSDLTDVLGTLEE